MHRRTATVLFPLLLVSCHPRLHLSQRDAQASRPNILFIYSDDHATAAIGTYANSVVSEYAHTPNIDALASGGLRFDRAFCTNSICAPARAVVLTGLHSHLNGVPDNNTSFDGSQSTFPKLLRASGYQTALIGKWHLRSTPTGFEYWDVLPGQGHYYSPDFERPGPSYVEGAPKAEGSVERRRVTGYVTEVITDLALDWLDSERDPDRPFLLMVQHKAPHRSWMPGPDEHSLHASEDLPEPATLFDDYATRAAGARTQEMSIAEHAWLWYDLKVRPTDWGVATTGIELDGPDRAAEDIEARMDPAQRSAWDAAYGPPNAAFAAGVESGELTGRSLVRWKYQRYVKDYLRCIAGVDRSVGTLVAWLEANDLDEDTIVIYSSDQGFYLGEHGWYDKRWMYEPSLRLPLIVSWQGKVPPGRVDSHLVQNLDLAPTFLDAAGLSIPERMQGRSLMPILMDEPIGPSDWRKSIYYRYSEAGIHAVPPHYGVRTEHNKLIYYHDLDQWELFDLDKDPDEVRNLYGDPAIAQLQDDLTRDLHRLRQSCGDGD